MGFEDRQGVHHQLPMVVVSSSSEGRGGANGSEW